MEIMEKTNIMELLEKFDIKPNKLLLYEIAFIHSSFAAYYGLKYNYERLEFLGDSVLSMVVSDYLYNNHPTYGEGKLTKIRANYVCQAALEFYSKELGLKDYIKVNLEDSGICPNEILSISADIFESFLGAIYIDQGIDKAKEFLEINIFPFIDSNTIFFRDYKSRIKEYGDAKGVDIYYRVLEEHGSPHDKTFVISIVVDNEELGIGIGKNKKEAQQQAAKKAIETLHL